MTCIIVQLVKTLFTLIHGNALLTKLGCSSHAALEVLASLHSAWMQDGHIANEKVPQMDQSDVMCTSSHYGRQRVCTSGQCCADDALLDIIIGTVVAPPVHVLYPFPVLVATKAIVIVIGGHLDCHPLELHLISP